MEILCFFPGWVGGYGRLGFVAVVVDLSGLVVRLSVSSASVWDLGLQGSGLRIAAFRFGIWDDGSNCSP